MTDPRINRLAHAAATEYLKRTIPNPKLLEAILNTRKRLLENAEAKALRDQEELEAEELRRSEEACNDSYIWRNEDDE